MMKWFSRSSKQSSETTALEGKNEVGPDLVGVGTATGGRNRLDVEAFVRHGVSRAVTTAAFVDIRYPTDYVSSFDDPFVLPKNIQVSSHPHRKLHVTVLGANGNLGSAMLKILRGNPLVGSVTAVVREKEKHESKLRALFSVEGELEERARKGYVSMMPPSTAAAIKSQQLHVIEGDVRFPRYWSEKYSDDELQKAISTSDVVVNCTAGGKAALNDPALAKVKQQQQQKPKESGGSSSVAAAGTNADSATPSNTDVEDPMKLVQVASALLPVEAPPSTSPVGTSPVEAAKEQPQPSKGAPRKTAADRNRNNFAKQVEFEGTVRMAHLASQSDAHYIAFSSYWNRYRTPGYWWDSFWLHRRQPGVYRSLRNFERFLISEKGVVLPPSGFRRLSFKVSDLLVTNPIDLVKRLNTGLVAPGDADSLEFHPEFRFTIFRMTDLLQPQQSSNYQMIFNDDLRNQFYPVEPVEISPNTVALVVSRCFLTSRAQWQHRMDLGGETTKKRGLVAPARVEVDAQRYPYDKRR